MSKVKNILFIMCDQLRADHLSCYGHKRVTTPAIDALAARGTRFTRAYVELLMQDVPWLREHVVRRPSP